MCLERGKKQKREFIRKLQLGKDKYIKLWKVIDINKDGEMVAQFHDYTFQVGKNTANGIYIKAYNGEEAEYQYEPGFHCFLSKANAERWKDDANNDYNRKRVVMFVKAKKSWITNVGMQSNKIVIVCEHIVIEE